MLRFGEAKPGKMLKDVSDMFFPPWLLIHNCHVQIESGMPKVLPSQPPIRDWIVMRHINEAQLSSDNSVINTYYHIIRLDIGHLRANLKEKKILYLKEIYDNETLPGVPE